MFLAPMISRATALLLCWLLVSSPLPAQAPDPQRAREALERGDKAEVDGRDEAARYAPQDLAIVGRSAVLRSKLVRARVENAERLGLAGQIAEATEELHA